MPSSAVIGKPASIGAYLTTLDDEKRAALESLRRTIRATVPQARECIAYGIPAYRLNGRLLVGFGAAAKHCAFYPMSATTVAAHAGEFANYDTSKGTIRFQADKPLPAGLVRRMVKARVREVAGEGTAEVGA